PTETAGIGRLGGCDVLSPSHPGGRRYLWLAANERRPNFVLDRRWHRSRSRCGFAYDAGKTSLPPWQRRAGYAGLRVESCEPCLSQYLWLKLFHDGNVCGGGPCNRKCPCCRGRSSPPF